MKAVVINNSELETHCHNCFIADNAECGSIKDEFTYRMGFKEGVMYAERIYLLAIIEEAKEQFPKHD